MIASQFVAEAIYYNCWKLGPVLLELATTDPSHADKRQSLSVDGRRSVNADKQLLKPSLASRARQNPRFDSRLNGTLRSQALTDFGLTTFLLKLLAYVFLAVCLIPLIVVLWLIPNTGANNICVDYAAFVNVVDSIFSGHYDWTRIVADSFIRTHLVLIPVLIHTAIAYFTHWDVKAELYAGMAFHVLRAFLIADLFWLAAAERFEHISSELKSLLRLTIFSAVCALVFAMSQTCIMIYGEASIAIGLCLLGFTLALWGLVKFGRSATGLALMLVGGLISTLSFGNVVPSWLTLLLALLVLPASGARSNVASMSSVLAHARQTASSKLGATLVWMVGFSASIYPYFYFLMQRSLREPDLAKSFGFFNFTFMLNVLGRPFTKDMGLRYGRLDESELSGLILIALLVACLTPLLITLRSERGDRKVGMLSLTSLLLFLFGMLSVWQVSVFRTYVSPWHASFALYCWLSILGLSLANLGGTAGGAAKWARAGLVVAIGSIATIGVLYLRSNTSYRDKQFFLDARAPVSAEYLRNYRTAPSYLESTVFTNDGLPERVLDFAGVLQRHRLSVFAPQQEWSLQGQFALQNVSVESQPRASHLRWIDGRSLRSRTSWRDYRHLNMYLPEGNVVEWRMHIPIDAKEAVFRTAVCAGPSPESANSGALREDQRHRTVPAQAISTLTIRPVRSLNGDCGAGNGIEYGAACGAFYVDCCDNNEKSLSVNLLPYRGKTIAIELSSAANGSYYSDLLGKRECAGGAVIYAYPRVEVHLEGSANYSAPTCSFAPTNVDVSADFPQRYSKRLDLPNPCTSSWKHIPVSNPDDPLYTTRAVCYDFPDKERLRTDDFDNLMVKLMAVPGKKWCTLKLHFMFDDGTVDSASLPLLSDQRAHSYVYPTRLLTGKSGARLFRIMAYATGIDEANKPGSSKQTLSDTLPLTSALSGNIFVESFSFVQTTGNSMDSIARRYQSPATFRRESSP